MRKGSDGLFILLIVACFFLVDGFKPFHHNNGLLPKVLPEIDFKHRFNMRPMRQRALMKDYVSSMLQTCNIGDMKTSLHSCNRFSQAIPIHLVLASMLKLRGTETLTDNGLIHATILGIMLWGLLGISGWSIAVFYFALGSLLVTSLWWIFIQRRGIAEGRGGRRGPENVWGSAFVGLLCAIGARMFPRHVDIYLVAFVSSFATKLSDTMASEIGTVYGKQTFLITGLKSVPPGTQGAVSAEGTAAGTIGSILLTYFAQIMGILPVHRVLQQYPLNRINTMYMPGGLAMKSSMLAAFVATTIESIIGERYQGRIGGLSNEFVNVINTAIGALVGALCYSVGSLTGYN